jgi:hypothetical protein
MAFAYNLKFLLNIDLFGKIPKLYYKGQQKRKTFIGSLATIIYIVIYLCFFIYKVNKMSKRVDVNFYETYIYNEGVPFINLTNENYYGGFALGNPFTGKTFIDETIYYVSGNFVEGEKIGDNWNYNYKELEFEVCKLEKFGSKYKEIFRNVPLDNLYCLKGINETLKGYMTSDVYSYYKILFHPCYNSTKNNFSCKPKEIIEKYITSTLIEFKMQDIELTPQYYNSPIEFQRRDIQGVAFKDLLQNIYTHLQIVNIETDEDILGFTNFDKIKKEKYLKYEESFVHVAPISSNIMDVGGVFCSVTIQLAGKVLTQKRTYTKIIDVLGEVGGFMEVVYSFFQVILVLLTDNLYDISLVNNLFSFDLDKNNIIIKRCKNEKIEDILFSKNSINNNNILNDISSNRILKVNNSKTLQNQNFNGDILDKNNNLISRNLKMKKVKKFKTKIKNNSSIKSLQTNENIDIKSINLVSKDIKPEKNNIIDNNILHNSNLNENKNIEDKANEQVNKNLTKNDEIAENRGIITEIKYNIFCIYFCFLCVRKRKNIQNNLLDKGLELISEKLDILNIFKKLFIYDKKLDKVNIEYIN